MLPNLILFGLLALGISGALALFLSLKHEFHAQSHKNRVHLEQVLKRLQDAERPAPEPPPGFPEPVHVRTGMNMGKRVQVVRLLRRGEDVSHVSAVLGIPRSEIELLMRVQKLSAQRAAGAAS